VEAVGIGFAVMLVLALLGVPLAFSMLLVGFAGFASVRGIDAAVAASGETVLTNAMNHGFSVVPLFVLMGNLIARAELSRDLFNSAYAFVGHWRGGLAKATVLACGAFAAVSGTSVGTAATMATVAMPEMRRFGYDDRLSSGTLAAGGTLGILIPPSVVMVIYGIMAQADIGKLFIAGILPGLITIVFYMIVIEVWARVNPGVGPRGPAMKLSESLDSLKGVWAVLVLFIVILGGIYFGVFTSTEAGGIGATGALAFCLMRRRLTWRLFVECVYDSGKTTAMLFAVGFGALVLAKFITITGVSGEILGFVKAQQMAPLTVIVFILLIYLVLGCLMESVSMVLMTVPVFAPLVAGLGYDLIWFCILVVVMTEIGQITPPVGINCFVIQRMVPNLRIGTVFAGIAPFLAADAVRLTLFVLVPGISLLLPSMMK
jgi:tripartite ATP-independent transporter DctM subunit